MRELIGVLAEPYETVDDVASGLEAVEVCCLPRRDLRGVFATAYLHITRQIQTHLEARGFKDAEWTRRYLICFGNLYRSALLDYERGETDHIPKSWRIAFDAAKKREGLVIQHLTLGINAHINHDLPLALIEAGIDPGRPDRYADHTTVNTVLEASTDGLKRNVAEMYAPVLHRFDRLFGRLDDEITNFSIPKAREHAWRFAVAIAAAPSDDARDRLHEMLDDQAAVLGRLVLSSPTRHPILLRVADAATRADRLLRRIGIGRRV